MAEIREHVPLAQRTTLELGGAARFFVEAREDSDVAAALAWAEKRGLPVAILGGGSNLVVRDAGFDGLVIAMATRGVRFEGERVTVAAGEPWDALVEACVSRDLAGLECLSGIPGLVGATPIQNVGAYGQDVSQTIASVRVLDRKSGAIEALTPAQMAFGYRDSALKRSPERAVVLEVTFRLKPSGAPMLAYAELTKAMAGSEPTLASVREKVIALRRTKSMVIDADDPNRRSAGSFFTNPIVAPEVADDVAQRAVERGIAGPLPRWPEGDRVKLAAGWLIERAGIAKGLRRGNVGISSAHALALVHHGGGTTSELLSLQDEVIAAVKSAWGVTLEREPVLF